MEKFCGVLTLLNNYKEIINELVVLDTKNFPNAGNTT